MRDLTVVPDDLLEMIKEADPDFPLCTAYCLIWQLEHSDCRGCKYLSRCGDFILGMEIGKVRVFKMFRLSLPLSHSLFKNILGGCKYLLRQKDYILGLEIGTKRELKKQVGHFGEWGIGGCHGGWFDLY